VSDPVPGFVHRDLHRLGVELNDATLEKLARYVDLLLETNRKFNLTAVRDRDQAWERHIIDSLTLMPFLARLAAESQLIDVGTGGGLPGIALALARGDLRVTLLEATGKKAKFCDQCIAELGLDHVKTIHDRAEILGRDANHRQRYDAAVCRAVGTMSTLLEYTMPLIRVGGVVLAMKGPKVEGELDAAGDALDVLGSGQVQVYDTYPPDFNKHTVVVIVNKQLPTDNAYPRLPGVPRSDPLQGL